MTMATQTKSPPAPREDWIDIAKGFAIAFVVLIHVFRGLSLADLAGHYQTFFLYCDYTASSFLMPLFFLVSGALYTRERKLTAIGKYKELLYKKFIRLGIPYLIFSCLQGFMRLAFNNHANQEFPISKLLLIPFQPFDHFWFLYASLLIFWLIPLMELNIRKEWLILVTLLALNLLSTVLNIQWTIGLFFINGVYFYIGAIFYRYFKHWLKNGSILLAISMLYLISNPFFFGWEANPASPESAIVCAFQAITGSFFGVYLSQFILNRYEIIRNFWVKIGQYSFEIYLLHTLFTASIRVLLTKLFHVTSPEIHIAVGFALGVVAPILIAIVAKRVPMLHGAFYPALYLKRSSTRETKKPLVPETA